MVSGHPNLFGNPMYALEVIDHVSGRATRRDVLHRKFNTRTCQELAVVDQVRGGATNNACPTTSENPTYSLCLAFLSALLCFLFVIEFYSVKLNNIGSSVIETPDCVQNALDRLKDDKLSSLIILNYKQWIT